MQRLMDIFSFWRVPDVLDSDDIRRRKILVIFVAIIQVIAVLVMISVLILFPDALASSEGLLLLLMAIVATVLNIVILQLNRSARVPGFVPSVLFVGLMILAVAVSDTPEQLLDGASVSVWIMPVVMATALFPPSGAFYTALAVFFAAFLVGYPIGWGPNPFSFMPLLVMAGASWVLRSTGDNALRKARAEAANNQAILSSIADGVVLFRDRGEVISANPAMQAMLRDDEIRYIVSGEQESRITWTDGRVFSVTYSTVAGMGTVAVFRDITRAAEVERTKDALIATVSHELRTPLTSIIGYADLLSKMLHGGITKPEMLGDMVEQVRSAASRLHAIVGDLLDHAQIQSGTLKLQIQGYDLRKTVTAVCDMLRPQANSKKVTLDVWFSESVPDRITGDANRFYQVMTNLIGNGVKFTEEGSVKVDVDTDGEFCVIRVADTGIGIPPARLPDIFEPFRRGSDYATRTHQGAGLGLSISKKLIILMGGTIVAASEVGKGSVFTLRIPFETPLDL